ncbi:9147_t:CDS:1, partial [Entrophospora sp. SA101]
LLLFGHQLKCVSNEHEKKTKTSTLKLVKDVSAITLTKCANHLATNLMVNFQEQ